jgi:pimeloyl-ACP methyl ester carboxylesterase
MIDDLRVRYLESNTRGTPLLLLHGLGGSLESWTNNIGFLSSKFRIISLDLPGFGPSDKPKISYSINLLFEIGKTLTNLFLSVLPVLYQKPSKVPKNYENISGY